MRSLLLVAAIVCLAGCGHSRKAATENRDPGLRDLESKLGLKIYPRATIVTSGETNEIVSANLRTQDSIEKVVRFYETELGTKGGGTSASYQVSADKGPRKYVVEMNFDGATNISIMCRK